MIAPEYRASVDLLLQLLPYVAEERVFALKGGTAINLFVRDMPRLSVDIDLTYLPLDDRASALENISASLRRMKDRLEKAVPDISALVPARGGNQEAKLVCQSQQAMVKIEVNTVIRGQLWPVQKMETSQSVQDEFGKYAEINVVSQAELFGGKICAALDRQHPRDLFDIQQLFDHEGLSDDIRLGLLVSLLSHNRPIHELLCPILQDQRDVFDTQFAGMTSEPFNYEDYEASRERLIGEIHVSLTNNDRNLLLSFKRGDPDWSLFPIDALQRMPAVKWKLKHVKKLKSSNVEKHSDQVRALEKALAT